MHTQVERVIAQLDNIVQFDTLHVNFAATHESNLAFSMNSGWNSTYV